MPSVITHAAAAGAVSAWFHREGTPKSVWIAASLAAVVPDLDAIGFWAGVPYDSMFGHRGITHSIFFAAALAVVVTATMRRATTRVAPTVWMFVAIASHGFLDAFTNGGMGIAFFAPFTNHRYFFPFRPIEVSPISVSGFFTERGMRVFASELVWVWVPAGILAALALLRRSTRPGSESPPR